MSSKLVSRAVVVTAIALISISPARLTDAQDRRHVTEPVIPPACAVLHPTLRYDNDRLQAPDNAPLNSPAIQKALDNCAPGHSVRLEASGTKNAFLSGPLELKPALTLVLGKGVHLVASNRPEDYARKPGSCGITTAEGGGCRPLILIDHADHVGIMGEGIIEGRGDQIVPGTNMTWWQIHNSVKGDVHHNLPWILGTISSNDLTLYRVTIRNAPNFNVFFNGGDGITVWGITIDAPWNSPNTDGLDPSGVNDMTVTHSYIRNGDDNIAIKAPAGHPSTHMTIIHNHFYEGHGMSIGSGTEGGVSAIRVTDLSIDHQKAGIHIKSNPGRGGLVHDVVYDDVCIRNTISPINIESTYIDANAPRSKWINGEKFPDYRDITLHNVRTEGGQKLAVRGISPEYKVHVHFDGVEVGDLQALKKTAEHADITLGPGPSNWMPIGDDVTVTGRPEAGSLPSCDGKFVDFPHN